MKLLFISGLLVTIGCTSTQVDEQKETIETNQNLTTHKIAEPIIAENDPYDINFEIDKKSKSLLIKIDLVEDGAYYIAPNSPGSFLGLLKLNLPSNDFIELDSKFKATPKPIREKNQFGEGLVDIIRQNTTHSLGYRLKTDQDFTLKGTVQFVIEPKCTLEKIPVTIFKKDGKLSFVKNCP